jgi:hypothetical protein
MINFVPESAEARPLSRAVIDAGVLSVDFARYLEPD